MLVALVVEAGAIDDGVEIEACGLGLAYLRCG